MDTDMTTMPIIGNKHYISVDDQSRIIDLWSDGPHPEKDTTNAVCINEQGSYQVYLTINGGRTEENPRWMDTDGIPLYKYGDGEVLPRTEEEISADRAAIPAPPPTAQEQLRADVDFLAAMQGVEL